MVVITQFVMWCDVVICVYRQYEHWECHFYGNNDLEGFRVFVAEIGIQIVETVRTRLEPCLDGLAGVCGMGRVVVER